MLLSAHKAAIRAIGKLPQFDYMTYRAYNKLLRVVKRDYIGKTYFGARMRCNPSDLIQAYVLHFGIWEPEISHLVEQILRPGDTFVDIGANVGYDTLLGSSLVGPQGQVIAIEASPTAFAKLKDNIALNNSTNIRAVNVAVSDRAGTLELFDLQGQNSGAVTTLTGRGGRLIASVEARPLAQILTPAEMARVRLIKIDVEGAEAGILSNLLDNIEGFPASMDVIAELAVEDDVEAARRVFDRMTQAGYYAYAIENDYEKGRYLSNRPLSPMVFTETLPLKQCDLLYTRKKMAEVAVNNQRVV
jgi:FkbM family methyltransferase